MKSIAPFQTSKLFDINYEYDSETDFTINQGGTSSGKTYSILQVLFLKAYQYPKSKITICGQDIPNLRKGAVRDAKTIYESSPFIKSLIYKYNETERIYYFKNGSLMEFNSYDDSQDAKNGKRDFLFINEANGVSYDIFLELYQRTNYHTWLDYNPTGEFWVHEKQILHRPNVRFIKSTYKNNPFIQPSIIKKIESYKPTEINIKNGSADHYLWEVYGLGNMGILEGVLFPKNELNFYDKKNINIKDIEIINAYVDIADTGEDWHCCVVTGNMGKKIFVLDVLFTKSSVEYNIYETAKLLNKYNPEYCNVEVNMGGTMYPTLLRPLLNNTCIIPVRVTSNKKTRIYSISSNIKKYCYFCDDYSELPDYNNFMKNMFEYKKDGSSKHDDAPDTVAGVVTYITRTLNHLYNE